MGRLDIHIASHWLFAIAFSIPLTTLIGDYFGHILNIAMNYHAFLLWFILSGGVAAIAGYLPAKQASMQPIREGLAHE